MSSGTALGMGVDLLTLDGVADWLEDLIASNLLPQDAHVQAQKGA